MGCCRRKLSLLSSYIERVRKLIPKSLEELRSNWERQKAAERALQVMIEIVIDIADASRYGAMVRFRNLVVHRYEDIGVNILYSILRDRLPDFEEFIREITGYVSRVDR
jgi:uncharacterized protein YutE (UPF0331/DUF86 family)